MADIVHPYTKVQSAALQESLSGVSTVGTKKYAPQTKGHADKRLSLLCKEKEKENKPVQRMVCLEIINRPIHVACRYKDWKHRLINESNHCAVFVTSACPLRLEPNVTARQKYLLNFLEHYFNHFNRRTVTKVITKDDFQLAVLSRPCAGRVLWPRVCSGNLTVPGARGAVYHGIFVPRLLFPIPRDIAALDTFAYDS
jgi:hypothetical protein